MHNIRLHIKSAILVGSVSHDDVLMNVFGMLLGVLFTKWWTFLKFYKKNTVKMASSPWNLVWIEEYMKKSGSTLEIVFPEQSWLILHWDLKGRNEKKFKMQQPMVKSAFKTIWFRLYQITKLWKFVPIEVKTLFQLW